MRLRQAWVEACAKYTQSILAQKLNIDGSQSSRFVSGQNGLPLQVIENFLELMELEIVSKAEHRERIAQYEREIERHRNALELVTDMWKELRRPDKDE